MRAYWKPALAILVLLSVAAFAAARWHRAFRGSAPEFLKARELTSPALWTDGRLRRSWAKLEQLLKQAAIESNAVHATLRELQFADVAADGQDTLSWETEEWINPGFAALARFESRVPAGPGEFVGYYTLGGTGVRYVSKQDPGNANSRLTSILLDQPVPPGGTGWLFRVQHQANRVTATKDHGLQIHLGRLPGPEDGLHGRGVLLPGTAKLDAYRPVDGAFYARQEDGILIFWFNSQPSADNPPLSVTFSLNR